MIKNRHFPPKLTTKHEPKPDYPPFFDKSKSEKIITRTEQETGLKEFLRKTKGRI
jgi:hypothetical protein